MGTKERLRELTPRSAWAAAARAKRWARKAGYLRERWARPLGTRPPIGLAVCAIFKDEARYLAEWVSFHRIQGVERFYLYEHGSGDDWRSALEPEIEAGTVEIQDWPFAFGQKAAYEHCLEHHRDDARWIAFIDVDEFLFSPTGRPLPEVLRSFDLHSGVAVNWRIYGTSGFEEPPEGLVTENYLWRAPDDYPRNRWMKCIVNPRSALGPPHSPHHFPLETHAVDEDGQPAPWPMRASFSAELLRINHYYSRSAAEFTRKLKRMPADMDPGMKKARLPPNTVRDEMILQFVPAVRRMLGDRFAPDSASTSSIGR